MQHLFLPGSRMFRSIRRSGSFLRALPATRSHAAFCARCGGLCPQLPADVIAGARRVAVLEGVVDATNIGAIFRSAAALGMDAVLLSPTCCDPLTRRAVRVSMGTVFQLPWATFDIWPNGGMALLRGAGFATCAMALRDDSLALGDERLNSLPKLAIVLGAEGAGLANGTIAACDYTVRIPMAHGVDSLNVAAASAVAFWELRAK